MGAQLLGTIAMGAMPARCEVCRAWPSAPICAACTTRFAGPQPRCVTCALVVASGIAQCGRCLRERPPLGHCHAAVDYAYPWSGLIGRFKFAGEAGWAATFAGLMRASPQAQALLDAADCVVAMPLSRERLAQRGYNQALELARRLAPRKVDAQLVLRPRDTPPQAELAFAQRQANMRHAFAVEPRRAHEVRGRRVLLVDDVMTTGASLFALAGVLLQAGAREVDALVLARTAE